MIVWKRQPEGGLYDFDERGWWVPPHPSSGFTEQLVTDRVYD